MAVLNEKVNHDITLPADKPRPVDRDQARELISRLVEVARGAGGVFVVSNVGSEEPCKPYQVPNPKTGELQWVRTKLTTDVRHVSNDENAAEALLAAVEAVNSRRGANTYICISLMQEGLAAGKKGGKGDVLFVLAAVTDWDGKNDPETRTERLPLPPDMEVETSPGQFQCWNFFDRPYLEADAAPVLKMLADLTGSDATHSTDHVFRVPGTWNWPSLKKILEYGRDTEPFQTRITVHEEWGAPLTLARLRSLIEKAAGPQHSEGVEQPRAESSQQAGFDWGQRRGDHQRPIAPKKIDKRLELPQGGDRSAICFGAINYLRSYGDYAPNEIFDALEERADLPALGHYHDNPAKFEKALRDDIVRAFTKPGRTTPKHADVGVYSAFLDGPPALFAKETVIVAGDYLPASVAAAQRAMKASGVDYFDHGGGIVRPGIGTFKTRAGKRESLILHPVGFSEMRTELTKTVAWMRPGQDEQPVPTNCPPDVAQAYIETLGQWGLRELTGIITAPTLREDGSLLDTPGYDTATGLLYRPNDVYPAISEHPTKGDAVRALARLKHLIRFFDFADDVSRSIWLCTVLTGVIRRILPTAPLFGYSAPKRGSGKGLLVSAASIIVSGVEAPLMTQGRTEEELEKRITTKLRAGHSCLHIDNCSLPLAGDKLNSILTTPTTDDRVLGTHTDARLATNVLLMASGNNLVVSGDMTRRVLRATLDPKCEFPEQREFPQNVVAETYAGRAELLVAALTILRAYNCAGRPPQQMKPLGSFEDWSELPRAALVWLGEPDPNNTQTVEADDPDKQWQRQIVLNWHRAFGGQMVMLQDVTCSYPPEGWTDEQRAALTVLQTVLRENSATPKRGEQYNLRSIGKLLISLTNSVFDGMRIEKAGFDHANRVRYLIRRMNNG
jgi:putative DNA primase/helicase